MPEPSTDRTPILLNPSLTVLVPALNEAGNLRPTIERLVRALDITVDDYEIIIVDDGSTDGTREEADDLAAKFEAVEAIHHDRSLGLGRSYVEGLKRGTKHYFTYVPGDNTWPYRSFVQLFSNLGKSDIVTSYSSNPEVRPAFRRGLSRAYTLLLNLLFGHRLNYYNGLTIYPKTFLDLEPITTGGFGFQAEALLKGIALGLSYIEVALPIDERRAGKSKAVTVRNLASVAATMARLFWDVRVKRGWSSGGALGRSLQPFSVASPRRHSIDEIGLNLSRAWDGQTDSEAFQTEGLLNIVITGASSGIGASLAQALAADGHALFICARREAELEATAAAGGGVRHAACDVADNHAVGAFFEQVAGAFGHVDALINCAAEMGPVGDIRQVDEMEWLETLKTDLWGPFLTCKHCIALMKEAKRPHIINFAGGGAFTPFPNYSAYAAAKAGVVRLTETLALELAGDGIMVNAIAPGMVASPIHEPTMAAGEDRAGRRHYRKTKAVLKEGGALLENTIDCVRALLSPAYRGLTGKTISVNFDPWRTPEFRELIPEISRSDLFSQRRINIWNMPAGRLRDIMERSWSNFDMQD